MTGTTVAAFDCGTNSIRLLIADLDPASGQATERHRDMQIVRLGEGVDRTGRLSDAALGRVFDAIDASLPLLEEHGVQRLRFCATSAARDGLICSSVKGRFRSLAISRSVSTSRSSW